MYFCRKLFWSLATYVFLTHKLYKIQLTQEKQHKSATSNWDVFKVAIQVAVQCDLMHSAADVFIPAGL